MKQVIFLTGASGSLGDYLLRVLLASPEVGRVFVLEHETPVSRASSRLRTVEGDITRRGLGLSAAGQAELGREVTGIVHAAGLTRFSAALGDARDANVRGTDNLLAFARDCLRLDRLCFLSTVFVAGRRTGVIREDEFSHQAGFVNHYERSKYEAEELVRGEMSRLPIAIYRLSTVLGDSQTGFPGVRPGGIHQAIRFLYQSLAPMVPGEPASPIDLISLDYAASAVARLFLEKFEAGRTCHICAADDTLTLDHFLSLTRESFLRERPAWRKRAIEKPLLTDLSTFELFLQSAEMIGNAEIARTMHTMKHFAPQLAFPKDFRDEACQAALRGTGVIKAPIHEVLPRVVRHLIQPALCRNE